MYCTIALDERTPLSPGRLRQGRRQAAGGQGRDVPEAPIVAADPMAIDLGQHLVLLETTEDMLHDDPPPGVGSVEPAFDSREQPVVPPLLHGYDDVVVWVVGRRPVVAPVEVVLGHARHLLGRALALEEGIVMDAAGDAPLTSRIRPA